MNELYYLVNGIDIIDFIDNNDRKSIPYEYIKNKGYELEYNYIIANLSEKVKRFKDIFLF